MKQAAIFIILSVVLATGALAVGLSVGPMSESEAQAASQDPVFYNELGFKLAQAGDTVRAQQAFTTAVALDGSYERARYNLATIAFQNGDYNTAIAQLRMLVNAHPNNAAYHFDLAQNLASQARYKDADIAKLLAAADEFEQADALQPGFPNAAANARIVRAVAAEFS